MASKSLFVFLALVALPGVVLATDYIVGDNSGWTFGFDYQAWAKSKQFFVGDRLIFRYPAGEHDVFEVDGYGFQYCVVIPPVTEAFTTEDHIFPLATEGRKWYICSVARHCAMGGMKLFIDVAQSMSPAFAPSPVQNQTTAPIEMTPAPAPSPAASWRPFQENV